MSSVTTLLVELDAIGVRVSTDGTKLKVVGSSAALTTELRSKLVASRASLIARLSPQLVASSLQCAVAADAHVPHVLLGEQVAPARVERLEARVCDAGGPPTPIVVDFETRAPVPLDQVGGRAYARHPDMEVLAAVLLLPDESRIEWTPGDDPPQAAFDLIGAGVPVLAHNAHGFDRFIWQRLGWPEATWIDSLSLARLCSLPGKLEAIAESILDIDKDVEGRAMTLSLGRLDRSGKFPLVTPAKRAAVVKYCTMDCLIARKAWDQALAPAYFIEPAVRNLDVLINDRGLSFDADLAAAIIRCEAKLAAEARAAAGVELGLLRSPKKLLKMLADGGVSVPDVRRQNLTELLEHDDLPDDVRAVVAARLASAGITGHKLHAALRRLDPDGRLRDTLSYHQAHTGRWAGRGFQPQNLPRGAKFKSEQELERAIDAAMREDLAELREIGAERRASSQDVLASLVRACVRAAPGLVLGVVDYAQVEARALLWLAGDEQALAAFRDGIDPYRAMAGQLFGVATRNVDDDVQRPLGKALVLGCGYQMGSDRFESYAEIYGIDWSTLGITPAQAVGAWRTAHPAVAGSSMPGSSKREGGLWQKMQEGAMLAARGERASVGSLVWERRGADLVCLLPSGRPLVYRNVELNLGCVGYRSPEWVLSYEHRGQRVATYGGKLTENVTQAVCRDLLADAMLRLEDAGMRTVLHVHDEVVAEIGGAGEVAEMESIMCRPPSWAAGLPLKANGFAASRYRK